MKTVLLIPLGEIDGRILTEIAIALEKTFPFKTTTAKPAEIPPEAFHARRRQYHSSSILNVLSHLKNGHDLILGITDVDLFVPSLNFVFGEADILRGTAIISLKRLGQEFYKLKPDEGLFVQRAVKEAIHEIGHLCGLEHCHDKRCIMSFSNSIRDTDRKGPDFCKSCRERLGY